MTKPEHLVWLDEVIDTMDRWLEGEPVWPYAKIIETWGSDFENYRHRRHREVAEAMQTGVLKLDDRDFEADMRRSISVHATRDIWTVRYGFAIPCAELLDELAQHGHIVEVGAGTGYMARLMVHRGIDVVASNPARKDYLFEHGKYHVLEVADAKTMVRRYPVSTIFCSWPTLNATWFRQALKAMQVGQKIVVIREDACAETTAWQYLDEHFEELVEVTIPCFNHMNDYAATYIKRKR